MIVAPPNAYPYGTYMQKKHGSLWRGKIVGYYSTVNTPLGYAIESFFEPGSVQIYPAQALELWEPEK